jgi:hypothetical protein
MPEVFGYKLDLKNLGIGQAHEENIDFIIKNAKFPLLALLIWLIGKHESL